ncbi:MAG: hypothetical protein Q8R83_06060 [Legionellaceae bacterium]|nr:hypothetical protein [Legionellaceae bacterium]
MSLNERIEARLKALFSGVGLAKKSVQAEVARLAPLLKEESTDEEIDAKLNERNAILPYADQKKHDDYLAGKEAKEKADKEAKRLADLAAGKKPEPDELPADTPDWAKAFMKAQTEKAEALEAQIAKLQGDKVTTSRREALEAKLKDAPESFRNAELRRFARMKFETDEEFNEYLTETETDAAGAVQADASSEVGNDRPIIGVSPTGGKVKPATEAELDAVMENL